VDWRPNDENDRVALTILVGFLVARLAFALSLGLGIDESYTIAISRRLSLSYFDHPPLHLWLSHFTTLSVGESVVARAPFVALFFATGWIYYRLTSGLFDPRAALVALFALNATPFFFASAGSWVVPRRTAAFWLGAGRVSGGAPVLCPTTRRRFPLASLARRWRRARVGGPVEVQRRAERRRTGRVHTHVARPAALAETSCSIRRSDCRAGDHNAGHRFGTRSTAGCHSSFRADAERPGVRCVRRSC
jgi:hypothetical protein